MITARRARRLLVATVTTVGCLTWMTEPSTAATSGTFANASPITIVDSATPPTAASPYPSTITVSGLTGQVADVNVSLSGITHTNPDDIDILLVGPGGQTAELLSDAGGAHDVSGVNLGFDDESGHHVTTGGQISHDIVVLDDFGAADTYPAPAPAGPYGTTLSVFDNHIANGVWRLYVVDDESGASGSITGGWSLTITSGVNTAPVANPDTATTPEEIPVTVAPLGNDTDADGDPLSLCGTTSNPAQVQSVTAGAAPGTLLITPAVNFNGSAIVGYTACDGQGGSASSTITVTVTPVNDPPVATNHSYSTNEDVTLSVPAPGTLVGVTDPEGDTITYCGAVAPAPNGALSQTITLTPTGGLTYVPQPNASGADTFGLQYCDGNGGTATSTTTVTIIPVNDPPPVNDDTFATPEDTPLTADVATNDGTDIDGDTVTRAKTSDPLHGGVSFNSDGSFTYTPNADYTGPDSFTYQANDGHGGTASATVTINVGAVDDAPVASSDAYSTNEDAPLNVPAPGVLANDTDLEGDTLSASLVTAVLHGTLNLQPDGSFTYTPNADYNGPDSFTYQAVELTGALLQSNTVTVSLTVNAVDDAPVALGDAYITAEDTPLTVAAPAVLANDTDLEGDTLSASLVSDVLHGTLALHADGSFTYTPNANYNGPDSFTYRAVELSGGLLQSNVVTVSLTVLPVNDAPVAGSDAYATNEDTTLTVLPVGVLGNDADPDGDPITASLVTDVLHGTLALQADGSFTYTPNADYNGSDSFTYRAVELSGGLLQSNVVTVSLTVNPGDDAPVALGDAHSTNEDSLLTVSAPGVLVNDTDLEGDTLSASLVTDVLHGTLALHADGSFTYTPNANYNGPDSFTYRAIELTSGLLQSNVVTVSLTVNPMKDAPTGNPDVFGTNEDTPLTVSAPGVLVNDSDTEDDPLGAALTSETEHGTVELHLDGSFIYTPDANYTGSDSFTYVPDDELVVTSGIRIAAAGAGVTVSLVVAPVNDPPVAADDAGATTGAAVSVAVLGNDTDVDGDPLSATLASAPAFGTATCSGGTCTYTPALLFNGTDSFTYLVADGQGGADVGTVVVTVQDQRVLSGGASNGSGGADVTGDPVIAVRPEEFGRPGELARTGAQTALLASLGEGLLAIGAMLLGLATLADRRDRRRRGYRAC